MKVSVEIHLSEICLSYDHLLHVYLMPSLGPLEILVSQTCSQWFSRMISMAVSIFLLWYWFQWNFVVRYCQILCICLLISRIWGQELALCSHFSDVSLQDFDFRSTFNFLLKWNCELQASSGFIDQWKTLWVWKTNPPLFWILINILESWVMVKWRPKERSQNHYLRWPSLDFKLNEFAYLLSHIHL